MAALRASRLVWDEICLMRSMNAVIGSDSRASSCTCSAEVPHHLADVEQGLPGGGHVGAVARGQLLDPVAQLGHAGRRLGVGLGDLRAGSAAARRPSPSRSPAARRWRRS